MPRVLLFTGKGGVGKTTCAAATALACASRGQRTLVLSTDPAHSLADAVDRPLGPEPRQLAPNLDAMEVDLYYSMRKYWGNMRELVRAVLRFQGADAIAAEELAALYQERWEMETALDELKTHLRGARIVLRSKTPELVEQEFYGLLMAHFAIRKLMQEAALQAGEDPDRLSFLHAVRIVRRNRRGVKRKMSSYPLGPHGPPLAPIPDLQEHIRILK